MSDSQSEAEQYLPKPLLPGWDVRPRRWSIGHYGRGFHLVLNLHEDTTEGLLWRKDKSLLFYLQNPAAKEDTKCTLGVPQGSVD